MARSAILTGQLAHLAYFVIDVHSESSAVVMATGFSGHGFKFAPVVGGVLADLAVHRRTDWPIELFRLGRLAKTGAE